MEIDIGPAMRLHLVYRIFPREVCTLGDDGFYHSDGMQRGHLVMSVSMGRVMYHRVEELMKFRCEL